MPKTNDNGIMKKISQLTFMAVVVMMLTGCAALNHEPAVQETWEMTYSDYRSMKYSIYKPYLDVDNKHEEYHDLTRLVTIERDGDRIAIKGMFPEYPDVWIKGKVKEDYIFEGNSNTKLYVFLEKSKVIAVENGKPVIFHNGTATCEALEDESSSTLQVSFDMNNGSEERDFYISDDGNGFISARWDNAFWLSNDKESTSKFYTTWQNGRVAGTGFPKMDNYIVNVDFRKVSTGNADTSEPEDN